MAEQGYKYHWEKNNSLTFTWTAKAFRKHHITSEETAYHILHGAQVGPAMFGELTNKLLSFYAGQEYPMPFFTTLGDGEKVSQKDLDSVRQMYKDIAVNVPYQTGDLLLLDNQLALHGRNTFEGERAVRVTFLE